MARFSRRSFSAALAGLAAAPWMARAAPAAPVLLGIDGEFGLQNSTSAQAIELGVRIAADQVNAAGGVLHGRPLEVVTKDHRSIPARGIRNIEEFTAMEDVIAVFGGRFSPVVIEQLPALKQARIPFLAVWSAADAIVDNGSTPNYAFRLSLRDSLAMPFLMEAARRRGVNKVGLLLTNTAWGRSNLGAVERFAAAHKEPRVVGTAWYNWQERSLVDKYNKLQEAGAEAVLLVANDDEAAVLVNEMAELPAARRVPVYSHWGVTGGRFFKGAQPGLKSVDFSVVQTFSFFRARKPALDRFMATAAKFGIRRIEDIESPVGTAHAYDMTHILAKAIDLAGKADRSAVRDALERVREHDGLVKHYAPPFTAASLAHRFALAAAGLAAAALLLTSLASWWLISRQHESALRELGAHERQYRAAAVGSDLKALAARMSEIAGSTILATGLVDSAGRETYLGPFLQGIRQINGVPVQVMFTDFQGREIATNGGASFSMAQQEWLRSHIDAGHPAAKIFRSARGDELVAMEPMVYPRTTSPEGAVLYKVALRDIDVGPSLKLEWGPLPAPSPDAGLPVTAVPVPAVFQPIGFRLRGVPGAALPGEGPGMPYAHILVITLLLFSVVVIAGVRLARLLTRDLQRLEGFSRGLLGSGLSVDRAPETGSTEVASLARSINDMLERLHQQHVTLLLEREKLTRLTRALQEADRKKDAFLAMLGHELRNPLAPISSGAELLRRLPNTDPRVARTSEIIARQVGQMTKIVSDLLDVSRVTRGLITLEKTDIDLAEVVSAAVEQLRPLTESRHHAVEVVLPAGEVVVKGDKARLVQVVGNLLTNAAKYTDEGGRIELRVAVQGGQAVLTVHDNGIGIAPDLMPEIFELFSQGAQSADRSQGGLGLGLALVKRLVELHGGAVDADSGGVGQGATFTVRLPLSERAGAAAAPAALPHEPAHKRLTVMLVDDNVDAAQMLAQWLAVEGHEVLVAHTGLQALALLPDHRVDAFILDIGLPGMDGNELARQLRARPECRRALMVALTGYGQDADKQRSAAAGFDYHMVKPADTDRLRTLLLTPHSTAGLDAAA